MKGLISVLKNRRNAMVITIAVVVLATVFGVHKSVGKEARKIEDLFYSGVYDEDEGYTQPSIAAQLDRRVNASLGLVTVASNYEETSNETQKLMEAREGLINAESITDKYFANVKLQEAYKELRTKLEGCSLEARDREGVATYYSTMEGSQNIIAGSYYNFSVSRFINGTLKAFPVNILKYVSFVHYPEYFGVEG